MAVEQRKGSGLLGWNDSINARRKPWLNSLDDRYIHQYFMNTPLVVQNDGTVGSVTTAETNLWQCGDYIFESYNIGTQGAAAPAITSAGLNIATCANDNTIGLELNPGITDSSKGYFVVGSSVAAFFRLKFKITTVASVSACFMGFRKQAANNATYTNYADYAILGLLDNSGDIKTRTAVGGTDASAVDTTLNWADGETYTLVIQVSKGGLVTYSVDGMEGTAIVNASSPYVFTDALELLPFFQVIRNATSPTSAIELIEWESGVNYTLFNSGTGGV